MTWRSSLGTGSSWRAATTSTSTLLGKAATWLLYASLGFLMVTDEGTDWPLWIFWTGVGLAVVARSATRQGAARGERHVKAVVMAGGEGTRLRPLTSNQPKPMVPVVGKPCMEHILELLKRARLRAR